MSYIDLYLLPVPAANLDAYREQAAAFGRAARDHGALSYREWVNDDPGEGMGAEDGFVSTTAVAEFDSRAHRDEVMAKVMADPRVKELEGSDVTDMTAMRYGGFAPLVDYTGVGGVDRKLR